MSRRVLIIEDNHDIAELVRLHLHDFEAEVDIEYNGASGLAQACSQAYDLVILDLMLPGLDGLEVCRRLRESRAYIPILMLTAKSSEPDRVVGLEMGADDYLTKPFSIRELVARVRAIFRRVDALGSGQAEAGHLIEHGELRIDRDRHSVSLHGRPLELTAREFDQSSRACLSTRTAAQSGLGGGLRGLRAHRQLAYQPLARKNRGRPGQAAIYPHGVGCGL